MTTEQETESTPCNNCGHVEDAHEDGGDCQEEGCECTVYSVLVEGAEDSGADEPIPGDG